MKKVLFVITCFFIGYGVLAQSRFVNGFKIGGGVSVDVPVSNLHGYSIGVGLDLLGQYGITRKLAITGDIGYTTIFAKNKDFASYDIVPIRAGIRFFPSSMFYLGAKVGVGIGVGKYSGSSTAYAFGAGLVMSDHMDVSASYEGFSKSGFSTGYLGLRLGYFFSR